MVRDPQTLKSKGYGFVSFMKKVEAENAIGELTIKKNVSRIYSFHKRIYLKVIIRPQYLLLKTSNLYYL